MDWIYSAGALHVKADSDMQASESHPSFCTQPGPPHESSHRYEGNNTEPQACLRHCNRDRKERRKRQISCEYQISAEVLHPKHNQLTFGSTSPHEGDPSDGMHILSGVCDDESPASGPTSSLIFFNTLRRGCSSEYGTSMNVSCLRERASSTIDAGNLDVKSKT